MMIFFRIYLISCLLLLLNVHEILRKSNQFINFKNFRLKKMEKKKFSIIILVLIFCKEKVDKR